MAVLKHRGPRWATVPQTTAEDPRLSFRSLGILTYLLTKPEGWTIRSEQLAGSHAEGRDAVRAALTQLEDAGYYFRQRVRDPESGQMSTFTCLSAIPWDFQTDTPKTPGDTDDWLSGVGKPSTGNPTPGNPDVGKPGVLVKTETYDIAAAAAARIVSESDRFRNPAAARASISRSLLKFHTGLMMEMITAGAEQDAIVDAVVAADQNKTPSEPVATKHQVRPYDLEPVSSFTEHEDGTIEIHTEDQ